MLVKKIRRVTIFIHELYIRVSCKVLCFCFFMGQHGYFSFSLFFFSWTSSESESILWSIKVQILICRSVVGKSYLSSKRQRLLKNYVIFPDS